MPTNISDFFIPSNSVYDITENDYQRTEVLINAAKAFARSTHKSVYIIDYFRKNFLYASETLAYICGGNKAKILEYGYDIYINNVPEYDQKMLLEVNEAGFNFFNNIPVEKRAEYTISYDFHIVNDGKKKVGQPYTHTNDDDRSWKNMAGIVYFLTIAKKTNRIYKNA